MSKFIILECNRDRSIDINPQNELTDEFKNRWTNQVSNSGIVVNRGDVLTIEQTIVNVKGASTEVMEFRGKNNNNGIVDNRIGLEVAYYINHIGKNTGNMPMLKHRVFRGVGSLDNLATNGNANAGSDTADGGNVYVAGDQRLSYTNGRFQDMIGDRSVGETFFLNYPFQPDNIIPAGQPADPYDHTKPFANDLVCPNDTKIFQIKLKTRGGGKSGRPNSGFIAGKDYAVITTDSGAVNTTMNFRVLTTQTLGDIPNVIETFEITDFGDKDFNGIPIGANDPLTITIPVGDIPVSPPTTPPTTESAGTDHVFTITSILNPHYKSSDVRKFDGKKYYPLQIGFTGLALFEDTQINRTDNAPVQPITLDFDINKIQSQPLLRTTKVDLEIPKGFQTPSNVANILTEQLGRPQKISTDNNVGDFLDCSKIDYAHDDPLSQFATIDNPNIVGSQLYQPASANFVNFGKDIPSGGSFCGRRTTFYQSIAWLEPERWTGLVPAFKQFSVQNSAVNINNDIAINNGATLVDNDNYGDFTRQGVGEFGTHAVIIRDFLTQGNSILMDRGEIIVSNIRFTRKNLVRLINMKKCEKYMGDLSLKLDVTSDNFKDFLSVNLDIGIYDDELSSQGLLTGNGENTNPNNINQRFKFATHEEADPTIGGDGFLLVHVDRGFNDGLNGFQRDLENVKNDGQQLSNVWIRSRYNEAFRYKSEYGVAGFTDNFECNFLTSFDNMKLGDKHFDTTNTDIDQVFGAGYFDVGDDRFYSIDDLNDMAKELDIGVVPVNTPNNPNDNTQNAGWRFNNYVEADLQQPPFIGFVSACKSGNSATAVFDPVKQFSGDLTYQGGSIGNWTIDASNCKYGMILGFDPSFTRNKAVCIQNNQVSNLGTAVSQNFLNMVNMGAMNPQIKFDPAFSRFSISGLNTPEFIGNGLTTDDALEFTPNDNPEQQVITFNRRHQILPSLQKNTGTNNPAGTPLRIGQYGQAEQEEGTFIDSQAGVAIVGLDLYDQDGIIKQSIDPDNYFNDKSFIFHGCLFDKMGFNIDTLLPKYGGRNAFFRDPTLYKDTDTFQSALNNIMKPLTTGADVRASITQATSLNFANAPMFDLGGDTLQNTIRPDAVQGEITASDLPNKFDFSYLTINSSLVQEGTDTIYVGGSDNQSKLPCMSYLTRENNESDFFYQNERTFNFTATKDFTITDITTDIRLPNGDRPNLDPHTTIIYKIEKPLTNPQNMPIPQAVTKKNNYQTKQRNLQK